MCHTLVEVSYITATGSITSNMQYWFKNTPAISANELYLESKAVLSCVILSGFTRGTFHYAGYIHLPLCHV